MTQLVSWLSEYSLSVIVAGLVLGLGAQLIVVPRIARRRGRHAGAWFFFAVLWATFVSGVAFAGWLVIQFPLLFAPVELSEIELAKKRKIVFSLVMLVVQFSLLVRVTCIRKRESAKIARSPVPPENPSRP